MDPDLATAVALFAALATLNLGLIAWLRADMRRMEDRLRAELAGLDARFERLEARMAAMEHGQAKLEGLLEGLREAIAGRARQAAE